MRNIQNNSLIRFFYGNLENIISEPFPDPVLARPGDLIRTLAHKYEIGSEDYKNLSICLLPIETPFVTPIPDRTPVINSIGTVRTQAIEDFTHFKIRVDGFLKNTYRQFTLTVEGQEIMPPFAYSGDSFSEMMNLLSEHMLAIPQTIVRTKVNGPIIDVWMMKTQNFVLASDLSVELGQVVQINDNTPVLNSAFLSSYVKGSNKDYEMGIIGTIVEGNEFNFDGISYVAKKGTTAQDVINFYTGGEVINILDSTTFVLSFAPGSITKKNSNIPLMYANLSSSGGGTDKWLIKLSGTYFVGNVLNVYTSGRSITHIVQAGDTNASIEAILNPDVGGFFTVTSGTQVNVRPTPGQNTTINDNLVQIFLTPVTSYPSATIDRYGVSVGSDVREGNEFKITDEPNDLELTVVATSSDTSFTVAEKLSGQPNPYFVFERIQNVNPPIFSASPGFAYTNEDKTPVTVISQPTMITPDQVVIEMKFPEYEVLPRGYYIIAIRNSDGVITAFSSSLDFNDHPYTSLIEASDKNNVFDFNYSEGGLVQRFRAEIAAKIETPTVNETVGQTIEGEDRSINVKIDYNSPFTSGILGINQAKSLVSIFKHSFLRINDRVFLAESPTYSVLNEYSRQVQMMGTLRYIEEFIDNYDRMIYPRVFAGSNAVISSEYKCGLRLFLRNATFTKEVVSETSIPANGYYLEVISEIPAKGFVYILVRDQTDVLVEMYVDKQFKYRSVPFRIQPNSKSIIELTEVSEIPEIDYEPVGEIEIPVIYEPDEKAYLGSGFDNGYNDNFH